MAAAAALLGLFGGAAILTLCAWAVLRLWARRSAAARALSRALEGRETVGFFHPYAHAGGGGERVLWCAIRAVQRLHPELHCVVYTGDVGVPPGELLDHARTRFGVETDPRRVHFVFLRGRRWVDAVTWPHLTLLGQSAGSVVLGWEALCQFRPDAFVDTMGYAFTLPLFALLGGCRVACYVHYPTISTDMLARVRSRDVGVCNRSAIARSRALSAAKLAYYHTFAWLYGHAGRFAEVVMVNSSWTRGHIDRLWRAPHRTATVFPPCDTAALAALPLERARTEAGGETVVSLAQFRPEKDQALQLRAFARFLRQEPRRRDGSRAERVRLVLAGGCRDDADGRRVDVLRALAAELGLREGGAGVADWDVSFRTNLSLEEVQALLAQAVVGLHTMREEHFGINVVEFMAAGAVPLAHKSGGPEMDIVTPWRGQRTGFLASDEASYAAALREIFALDPEARLRISAAAREAVRERFAQEAFEEAIAHRLIAPLRRGG